MSLPDRLDQNHYWLARVHELTPQFLMRLSQANILAKVPNTSYRLNQAGKQRGLELVVCLHGNAARPNSLFRNMGFAILQQHGRGKRQWRIPPKDYLLSPPAIPALAAER